MNVLTPKEVAREFHRTNSWRKFGSAQEMVDAIDAYMASRGLAKSTLDRLDIADWLFYFQRQAAEIATPEENAFDQNLAEGTTADDAAMQRHMDELALAGQVAQMSQAEFGANRERFGLSKSVFAHLAGE